ncbi:unnamed protein product [Durusdinium trenchii]|uniref:Uncharacterized protein n=1 Tax=Durusdinium trenchii TaxID=1381693 RepID=A0ABP0QWR2_9DINO
MEAGHEPKRRLQCGVKGAPRSSRSPNPAAAVWTLRHALRTPKSPHRPRSPGALPLPWRSARPQSGDGARTPRLGGEVSEISGEVPSFEIVSGSAAPLRDRAVQGHEDISQMLAWMQPMKCGNYVHGLSSLAFEIEEKTQEGILGCHPRRSCPAQGLFTLGGSRFFARAALPCSAAGLPVADDAGALGAGRELMESIFCDWPRTLPSLQDLRASEVETDRFGQLTSYAQMVTGLRASAEAARQAQLRSEAQEQKAMQTAKKKSRAYEELRVQAKRLEEEREQCRAAMEAAEKKLAETEEFLRTFKQQTKIALNDYGDIQYREATLKSDFNSLQVQCKEKDHLIGDLRDQTVALTHETHVLEEKLIKVEREMERRTADAARLPELYEKLEYFEAEEAVHGVAFARRVAQEVLGKSLEDLAGRLPERMAMEKKTKVTLEAVLQTLLTAMRDREKSKEQVLKTHSLLEEVKQLVPIWNESSMQDLLDAYDEDSAVHRQVYSMNDKRSFAGLGLDTSVPPYLRAEGFVKHRYMSKKECEDIMESFFFEAPSDMHFFTLHQELHQSLQRRFKDPEEFTEFAYAFICSLEAYRDDPDFELFDLMLAGAVHPSIMQDQKNLLRELQGLVHNCADGIEGTAVRGKSGKPTTRDQVNRQVMRAVMQATFPVKSVDRMNSLMRALHKTLELLFEAGRASSPDAAFVSDLFSATADGTQTPFIEEMRRQHLYEVLEFTAEISTDLIRSAGGESFVNLHGRLDPFTLVTQEETMNVLMGYFPEVKCAAMVHVAWKLGDESSQRVAEVLQKFRHHFLLKHENAWVVVSPKAVVERVVELGPGKLNRDGTDEKVAPQRNRALKVLDNPYDRDERYTPQQLLKETSRVPRKFTEEEEVAEIPKAED